MESVTVKYNLHTTSPAVSEREGGEGDSEREDRVNKVYKIVNQSIDEIPSVSNSLSLKIEILTSVDLRWMM